jgi:hypothetical protein
MRYGLFALLSLAVPATAGELSLVSPIDCDLDGPCYIQQYVDHDPSENASDFTCSGLTYDGHKGTDFALPTYDMIEQGINVIAAAAGTVGGMRDGMEDVRYTSETTTDIAGRECGNGVVIRHDDGWETQYCHLRKGSILVESGQQVQAGDILGQVGMSGRAAFPHVHLSVRRDGEVIDPFDPDGTITCGEVGTDTLWSDLPTVRPGGIISVGTAAAVPEFEEIRANTVAPPDAQSDAMVIYAFLFGIRPGDIVTLSLTGPDGTVIERDITLERAQAQSFRAIGIKRRGAPWPSGTYSGQAILTRDGTDMERQTITMTLP